MTLTVNTFLSPTRRGRGILVAPGFCPATRFLVGAKTQKLLVKSFSNFNTTFLATWGCASDFLEMLPKFKMAARSGCKNSFVGAKTLKFKVRNYSNSTITFSMIWRCAGDFSKVLLKFKMAATYFKL